MKIANIELHNFRCFEHLEMTLHNDAAGGGMTVLVAENGKGKTSVLDGISFILGRFLLGFSGISGVPRVDMQKDVRSKWVKTKPLCHASEASDKNVRKVRSEAMRISALMTLLDSSEESDCTIETHLNKTRFLTRPLRQAAGALETEYSVKGNRVTFPIVAYYNTERAVVFNAPKRLSRKRKKQYTSIDAYDGALDGFLDFRRIVEWVVFQEDRGRREIINRKQFNYQTLAMRTVQYVVKRILPGFRNLHTETEPLRLMIDCHNENTFKQCQVDEILSDGQRVMLVLALDIVSRMLEANEQNCQKPQEVLNTAGIVLIDEVELHLHPAWQQHVLLDLRSAFPKIQFIVTTHSPQVVSSVPRECLRILDGQSARIPEEQTEGVESQEILASIFGTSPAPPLQQIPDIQRFAALVAQGKGDTPEAITLLDDLYAHFGENYPALPGIIAHRDFLRSRNR